MTAGWVYLLYMVFALGGVGLLLAMPKPEGTHARAGAAVGGCAIVGLLALVAMQVAGDSLSVLFYVFAAVALYAAGRVVTHPAPTYSAVYFGLVVLCVAVLLVLQMAEFVAVALIIIYAGAILVTYAFVIMLAQQSGGQMADLRAREPLLAILASFLVMGAVAGRLGDLPDVQDIERPVALAANESAAAEPVGTADEAPQLATGNTIEVGRRMFTDYVVAVQLGGLLLLVAMVGAIAIARKRVPIEAVGPPPPPIGQIGREVPPY